MEVLEFNDSNKMQAYSTHSIFRYFGKLPPTLVSKLMDLYVKDGDKILDLMCGSGTTSVEAYLRSNSSTGIDVNPLSAMITQVKTTKIRFDVLDRVKCTYLKYIENITNLEENYYRPKTRNIDYWFTSDIQKALSAIKYFIDNQCYIKYDKTLLNEQLKDIDNFLNVTYASIIRKVSNASPKTGRIFRCAEENKLNPYEQMLKKFEMNAILISELPISKQFYSVKIADARNTGLMNDSFEFILNHPPYFALYKYSSDVLRFELEWLNFNRSDISKIEIEDGFKTTQRELLNEYIKDMKSVFEEMYRLIKPSGKICVVVSDSKLREEQLPVVENLLKAAQEVGLIKYAHLIRPVSFTQASYHRSANPNIKTNEDHVLVFTK